MTFNKKITAIVSIVTGSVILATAAFANYVSSNGYDVYKTAIKKLIKEQNYTLELLGQVKLDGNTLSELGSLYEEIDTVNKLIYSREEIKRDDFVRIMERSVKNGVGITKHNYDYTDGGELINSGYMAYVEDVAGSTRLNGTIAGYAEGENEETVDKAIRFMELAADMVVGDLKNNFVYIGESDGGHEYSITLESFQIPEIVNAGMSLIGSSYKDSAETVVTVNGETAENRDPFASIYENMAVKGGTCRVVIDDMGRITENNIIMEFSGSDLTGNEHVVTIEVNASLSKYGETEVSEIDLSDCKKVQYASTQRAERIAELEKLIEQAVSEEEKKNYKAELEYLKKKSDKEEPAEAAVKIEKDGAIVVQQ